MGKKRTPTEKLRGILFPYVAWGILSVRDREEIINNFEKFNLLPVPETNQDVILQEVEEIRVIIEINKIQEETWRIRAVIPADREKWLDSWMEIQLYDSNNKKGGIVSLVHAKLLEKIMKKQGVI